MYKRDLRRARRLLPVVLAQLDELIAASGDRERMDRRVEQVSKWSVGEHVEHLALAHSGIVARFDDLLNDTSAPGGSPSLIGRCALTVGRIPRGRGKAPEGTRPQALDHADITQRLTGMRERLTRLASDSARIAMSKATFQHPVFGPLRAVEWLRFLEVHQNHHWRIVRDIERSS